MRGLLYYIFLYIKGLCIGATGVLHGISGGSMALLLGVHHHFVFSIRAFDARALSLLRQKRISAFWKKINGNFLLVLFAGITIALFTLRPIFNHYYQESPILVASFFFSLVIIAALLLLRKITRWRPATVVYLLAGFGLSYFITCAAPMSTPDNGFFAFLTGIVTGITFVIPGVSGAFILMIFGKYQYILASFGALEIDVITLFVGGAMLGIAVTARFIAILLTRYFNATVALFAGLMTGSLNKIWPWREVLEYVTTVQGKRIPAFEKSILPWRYLETTGKDPQVFYAILMMALGVLIVVIIEKVAVRLKTQS